LQSVDQQYHLTGGRVNQADIGRIEPSACQRRHRHGAIPTLWNPIKRRLSSRRIFLACMPHAHIASAVKPVGVLNSKTKHATALIANKILCCDANSPSKTGSHAHDLVGGVLLFRSPDFWN